MRQGFTLLEILLVLSTLVLLLSIVWGVTYTLIQMEKQRAGQTQQQRTVRHWTQKINDDFRSAIQDTDQDSSPTASGETIRHFGVTGTAEQLRIDVAHYAWRTEESSELRTIFYEFHPANGLVRTERDYAATTAVAETIQNAPEIIHGRFQYYDGGTWHEHWASLDRKSVPSAIEITFYSLSASAAKRQRNGELDMEEPFLSRVVVQIPSAFQGFEPYRRAQPPDINQPLPIQTYDLPPSLPPPNPFRSLFGDD
ncbi:MAG: type II secretion system protein GspJ [Planctomycetaceae bacterium]|nr:type II secretion system protein GspJ [Planctomycetaceae bacterium]